MPLGVLGLSWEPPLLLLLRLGIWHLHLGSGFVSKRSRTRGSLQDQYNLMKGGVLRCWFIFAQLFDYAVRLSHGTNTGIQSIQRMFIEGRGA